MTDLYPLSVDVRDRIDFTSIGEEPHAFEEGTWTFQIGSSRLTVIGFYGSAAQRAVEVAQDGEAVVLVSAA